MFGYHFSFSRWTAVSVALRSCVGVPFGRVSSSRSCGALLGPTMPLVAGGSLARAGQERGGRGIKGNHAGTAGSGQATDKWLIRLYPRTSSYRSMMSDTELEPGQPAPVIADR